MLAYDRQRGHVLWQNSDLKYRSLSAPMAFAGQALVIDAQGYAHVLQLSNGEFCRPSKNGGSKALGLAVIRYQDNIFLLSLDGRLMRLGLK